MANIKDNAKACVKARQAFVFFWGGAQRWFLFSGRMTHRGNHDSEIDFTR